MRVNTTNRLPTIELVTQMWLGYPTHEALATHQGKLIKKEKHMNGEFLMVGTPLSEVNENQIPQSAFQRVL
jgi:hypothetical protein